MQQDMDHKISIVIDKTLPNWQVLNTVAHISGYFGNALEENFTTGEFFQTKDGALYPRNSQFPIIALSAEPDQLTTFAKAVREEKNIRSMFFLREMIETNSDEELAKWLGRKNYDEVEVLGVGIFGENQRVRELTREFKLWK